MTTVNYISTGADPALDDAFEQALARARAGLQTPLGHLIGGEARSDGPAFERADPCDASRIVSRAHAADADTVAAAVRAARAPQPPGAAPPAPPGNAPPRRPG